MRGMSTLSKPIVGLILGMVLTGCATHSANQPTGRTPALIQQLDGAAAALRAGEIEKAERLYMSIATDYPKIAVAHLQLGNMAYQSNRSEAAQQHFKTALEREPGHVLATYNLAMVHLQSARELLADHKELAPVTAARPGLVAIRQALEGLNSPAPHQDH
jgi:Tfp pilus assembly protein PilF